ncbi:MAG: class II aldolase/adducin family protein [Clostridia bacterium]|nr:class II aldolase/adducin family protein [Deltaproteobacteria bacterium]
MHVTRRSLEDQIAEYGHRLHNAGWVANHDGNITVRLAPDRFLATPTGVSKSSVCREQLIVVDGNGQVVSGSSKPFSEIDLHLYIYRHRPDVRAVIHAHPPTATGFAVAGIPVITSMLAESVISLGAEVPLVPYARPGTAEATLGFGKFLDDSDALMLSNHGALTYGSDLETAFLRMELVEHLAKIQLVARQMGGIREIPSGDMQKLLASRTNAGLGRAGRARVQNDDRDLATTGVKAHG